jgi:cytochrome c-type biogenesis protein CcmE
VIVLRKQHKQRLAILFLILLGVSASVALAIAAFNQNIQLFFSPTQIIEDEIELDRVIRLGGMVSEGSVQRASDSLLVKFDLTDFAHTIQVQYTGILPDLFREGQGIVAIGRMQADGSFLAQEVLAKHDENYMPPEVAEALEAGKAKVGKEP